MSLPKYGEYTDSGSTLLGFVPRHWTVVRLRNVVSGSNAGEVIDKSYWGGNSELLYTCAPSPLWSDYFGFPATKRTKDNDLLLTRNGTPYVHIPEINSIYTNVVQRITLTKSVNRRFLGVALQNAANHLRGYGVSIESLNYEMWKELQIAIPPLAEQTTIAAFLDREIAKIDALIAEQEKLIALLAEKRQATISHAVTRGLDPDAPMKDSGVAWLGEVPAHWKVGKAGFYVSVLPGYAFPSAGFSLDNKNVRLLRGVNVGVGELRWDEVVYWERVEADRLDAFELNAGDVVIGMDRPLIAAGMRVALVKEEDLPCLLLQRVAKVQPGPAVNGRFIMRLLASQAFAAHFTPETTGVSVPHISGEQITNFVVPVPALIEQRQICDFIDSELEKLDSLKRESDRAISLLVERRAALIAAAVTGKINVRGEVPQATQLKSKI